MIEEERKTSPQNLPSSSVLANQSDRIGRRRSPCSMLKDLKAISRYQCIGYMPERLNVSKMSIAK